jgi:aspartate kinase
MMLIVKKFGGTSVATPEKIRLAAGKIAASHRLGDKIVVVLSAMAGETDRLLSLARQAHPDPDPKYCDLLVSTGEQVTVSLMAIALKETGVNAETLLGHQVSIVTDNNHGKARILKIDTKKLLKIVNDGKVPVIAGFQGVTEEGLITTLGRGGSDITAVAIAAALKDVIASETKQSHDNNEIASSPPPSRNYKGPHVSGLASRVSRPASQVFCEIFTDVEGVFTADPRICEKARKLPRVSYEEMLELADSGAKVLHTRSVEVAAKYRVPIHVRSSFSEDSGTWIVPEEEKMEDTLVSGITCNINEAKVAIRRVPDKIGITARIFEPIAKAGINVDMILQNVSAEGYTDLTFTVPKEDLKRAIALAEVVARQVEAGRVEAAGDIAKISVVGVGMRSHAGIAHRMFDVLAKEGIAIQMIGTSEIKVSIVIDMKYAELAVRILHDAFQLDKTCKTRDAGPGT